MACRWPNRSPIHNAVGHLGNETELNTCHYLVVVCFKHTHLLALSYLVLWPSVITDILVATIVTPSALPSQLTISAECTQHSQCQELRNYIAQRLTLQFFPRDKLPLHHGLQWQKVGIWTRLFWTLKCQLASWVKATCDYRSQRILRVGVVLQVTICWK